jgi:hypothetical protein
MSAFTSTVSGFVIFHLILCEKCRACPFLFVWVVVVVGWGPFHHFRLDS